MGNPFSIVNSFLSFPVCIFNSSDSTGLGAYVSTEVFRYLLPFKIGQLDKNLASVLDFHFLNDSLVYAMDQSMKDYPRLSRTTSSNSDVLEPPSSNSVMQRTSLVGWLNSILPDIRLPLNTSDEELRSVLADGSVLCRLLNKLKPGSITESGGSTHNSQSCSENIQRILSTMDEMGLPRFQASDLEKGYMKPVLDCLLALQTQIMILGRNNVQDSSSEWKVSVDTINSLANVSRDEFFQSLSSPFRGDGWKFQSDTKSDCTVSPRTPETPTALINHAGHKFHEVFQQLKHGSYADLPAARISEMMKPNSLDNAPTQSLLSVVNGILDESIERKTGEIPHPVACLLKKVVQEVERRICTQAEHLRTQNNLFKAREEKYQSRIRVLEALAAGTSEETQIVKSQLKQIKDEMGKLEEEKKVGDQDVVKLMKERDEIIQEIANLGHRPESLKNAAEGGKDLKGIDFFKLVKERDDLNEGIATLKQQLESSNSKTEDNRELNNPDVVKLSQEKDDLNQEMANLRQQLESLKNKTEEKWETKDQDVAKLMKKKDDLNQEIANLTLQLECSRNKTEEKKELKNQDMVKLMKEKDDLNQEIAKLRQHLESSKNKTENEKDLMDLDVEKLMKEKDNLQEEITNLKQQLQSVMDKTEKGKESKDENVKKLTKENDNLDKEIANLRQQLQSVKDITVEEMESKDQDVAKLIKEKDELNQEITNLKQQLQSLKEKTEQEMELKDVNVEKLTKEKVNLNKEIENLMKEKEELDQEITSLRQKMETDRRSSEEKLLTVATEAEKTRHQLEDKLKRVEKLLTESRDRVKELKTSLEEKSKQWDRRKHIYHIFTDFQLGALRELRFLSQFIQQEILRTQESYSEDFVTLGSKIKILDNAARNYHPLLAENRKLHNELLELKGNIRVYCRIRPLLPGQKGKQSITEYIGENGELIVMNPTKKGKEGHRSFKFNKVYGPTAIQAEIFSDIQPLIRSVVDGYNVCIFAYGQTGSGKTYTMTGPDGATEVEYGVNYRALNDLFRISQSRDGTFSYEISVQMVEIYNEQIRDLLTSDSSQKRLGVLTTSKPNGLAVPDACIQPVNSTSDVMRLMDIGLKNRARGSTALNQRSSRSHSVVSIHCTGIDLKSGSTLRGSLHLVDLAGSERIECSEGTGDRLKEAQHINKSLAALGDVISALSQKSNHVPYRNSKLTQVLQSSLGGHAKTLMFVQLNPDVDSYSESVSTLKFAERVSGIELGAAKSNKEAKDVRELMEQVGILKNTRAKKDEETQTPQRKKLTRS